jgi:VWFA-related protein
MTLAASLAAAATKLTVTVVEAKSGKPIANLKADDFLVTEDKTTRKVEAAEFASGPIDPMLLVDTSLVGEMVQPVAASLISQIKDKEQMAIVSFDSSANMIQDFTSSRELLHRALRTVKYGNTPRVVDALFAAMDGGFEHATYRRVILLVTAGMEGGGRVSERETIRLARKTGVSIYPVYVAGAERGLFEALARRTGGASFNLRDMERAGTAKNAIGERIFEVMRSSYTVTLAGNLALSERLKVEVRRPEKLSVSALPLE